jgi:glutathione S-transferase
MKRAPFGNGGEIEIRQVFAAEDFGEAFTPELREHDERLREQAGKK